MSVLVVGVSHKTAPVAVLERLALDADGVDKLVQNVMACEHVLEATALTTCNRVEVYAEVDRFHGSVESVSRLLCEIADEAPEDVVPHLYVHYDDGAVSHVFEVAAGLDSMVIGESQILGQVRHALRIGQESGTVGPALNVLFQQALRVGKRVHAETDVQSAAPSLVSLALDRAAADIGPVAGKRVLVVGAGSMAGLAVATVSRLGAPRWSSPAAPRPTPAASPSSTTDARSRSPTCRRRWPTATCSCRAPAPPVWCCRWPSWPRRVGTPNDPSP